VLPTCCPRGHNTRYSYRLSGTVGYAIVFSISLVVTQCLLVCGGVLSSDMVLVFPNSLAKFRIIWDISIDLVNMHIYSMLLRDMVRVTGNPCVSIRMPAVLSTHNHAVKCRHILEVSALTPRAYHSWLLWSKHIIANYRLYIYSDRLGYLMNCISSNFLLRSPNYPYLA